MVARLSKKKIEENNQPSISSVENPKRITHTLDHLLVAEDKSAKMNIIRRTIGNKLRYILFVIVAVVIVVGLYSMLTTGKKLPDLDTNTTQGCSYQVLSAAKSKLAPSKVVELRHTIDSIVKLPGYDKDVNCLYVITQYYINISDYRNSKQYYSKLAALYNSDTGYSPAISDVAKDPKTIKPIINFLEKQDAAARKRIEEDEKHD